MVVERQEWPVDYGNTKLMQHTKVRMQSCFIQSLQSVQRL